MSQYSSLGRSFPRYIDDLMAVEYSGFAGVVSKGNLMQRKALFSTIST